MEQPKTTKNVGQPCIICGQPANAQATVEAAKAEGAAEVRRVIQQRLIDVRLARSVARLSFAQDEYDAQISALESILKQCEEPFSSNNENGLDLQATVEALQHERDHAKKMEAVQKEVADNQTWHVRELQDWRDQVTLALQREGGARFEDVPGYVKALVSALDAEREKVKGLEDEGVKLFEWRLALHSLTPGGSEFCTPDACEQWVRKSRTSQREYIIEQIKQRKGLQTELTQLQALVRALKGDANYTYHVADNPDEDDQYTVYVHVNGQGYGAIAEFYSRNEALAYAEIKRVATLPATPTGEAT